MKNLYLQGDLCFPNLFVRALNICSTEVIIHGFNRELFMLFPYLDGSVFLRSQGTGCQSISQLPQLILSIFNQPSPEG
jgi:hypothetical protein